MKIIGVLICSLIERIVVILQAMKDIVPFEQMRFDYGDEVAQALFNDCS